MVKRGRYGLWLVAGALFVMQAGVAAPERRVVSGPSQGSIPDPVVVLAAATMGGGGGGGASVPPTPQRESGGGSASTDPFADHDSPIQSQPRQNTNPGGGGGGGSMVVPVLRGNPDGLDAVSAASPSPDENGGGGGGAVMSPNDGPFIRVLPGGDAADWARSPSPGTR